MFNTFITFVNGVVDAVKAALQAMFSRSRRQSGAGPEGARFRLPPSGRITTKSAHDYEGSTPSPPQPSPAPRPPQPAPHATEPAFSPAPIPEAAPDAAELEMPISPAPVRRRPPVKEAPASAEPTPA
ncbi:MAG TPA: hypothetical protein VFY65_07950, partial [Longimicrobium sp.]|nr:hypothetical protein [Longimicrobium sp.]